MIKKSNKHTFVFEVEFRSTAILIKVVARDEDEAWEKIHKRRETKYCYQIKLKKMID